MGTVGIINFLKPAGMTSHDAVYMMRKLTGEKRVGHTGTLDPMAAGVLPLCIGNATRIIDYLDPDVKEYRCELLLGIETDTWDIWGTVLSDKRGQAGTITEADLRGILSGFSGEIMQMPPTYSSIKVNGKHLYEYARKDQEVTVEPRPVIIHRIELLSIDSGTGRALFDVRCSKGTYIRSICAETGKLLGCGAAMSFLSRTATGAFRIEQAATAEELREDWENRLLPIDFPLGHLGRIEIPEKRLPWFSGGGSLRLNEVEVNQEPESEKLPAHIKIRPGLERAYRVYCGAAFLGVMLYDEEQKLFLADKVFCR